MTRKQRIHQCRLAQPRLPNDHHVELEPSLEQLVLNLSSDGCGLARVKTAETYSQSRRKSLL